MMVLCACSTLSAKQRRIDFTRDIKPILSDRCYKCHGPDGESREADLRLDLRASAQVALSSAGGQVIAPGKPSHSALYLRITDSDADLRMPPPDSNLTLTSAEITLIVGIVTLVLIIISEIVMGIIVMTITFTFK